MSGVIGHRGLLLAGGGGASVGYLDSLATLPAMALSLTKVFSTATQCLRVRRSNDNTEQDIGFSGDALDTSALAAFVGSNSGYVVKWYDQSGNGEHAEQATAANQPRIVNAGVIDSSIVFSGTQILKVTSLTLGTPQVGLYSRYRHAPSAAGTQVVFEMTTVVSSNIGTFAVYTSSGASFLDSYNSSGSTNRARQMTPATVMSLQTYLMDRNIVGSGELAVFLNGASRSSTEPVAHEQTGNYLTNDMYIGARATPTLGATIEINNLVVYRADTSALRTSIEAVL